MQVSGPLHPGTRGGTEDGGPGKGGAGREGVGCVASTLAGGGAASPGSPPRVHRQRRAARGARSTRRPPQWLFSWSPPAHRKGWTIWG